MKNKLYNAFCVLCCVFISINFLGVSKTPKEKVDPQHDIYIETEIETEL